MSDPFYLSFDYLNNLDWNEVRKRHVNPQLERQKRENAEEEQQSEYESLRAQVVNAALTMGGNVKQAVEIFEKNYGIVVDEAEQHRRLIESMKRDHAKAKAAKGNPPKAKRSSK